MALQKPLLTLDRLSVQRGELPLCLDVSLDLNVGDICHIVGDNGTGKTTLLMQLAGLLPILQGEVYYQGLKSIPIQPLFVSHQLGIHPDLTVEQNLTFLLNLYGISPSSDDIDLALEWVGLQGFEKLSSSHLSAGQTRRITLARLKLITPEMTPLWLLDEPMTALDVAMVAKMEARLLAFSRAGGTVLMTSHQSVGVASRHLDLTEFMV